MKMKILSIVTISFIAAVLLISGCGGPPEGMKEFRRLTEDEEDRLVEIALETENAVRSLEKLGTCEVIVGWADITWQKLDGEYVPREITIIHDEEQEKSLVDGSGVEGELYADIILYIGEPSRLRLDVIINPDTRETVHIQSMGLKTPAINED